MTQQQKILLSILVLLIFILVFKKKIKQLIHHSKKESVLMPEPTINNTQKDVAIKPKVKNIATQQGTGYPLAIGSKSNAVKILQGLLNLKQDGIFGNKTMAALQKKYGISQIDNAGELNKFVEAMNPDKKNAAVYLSADAISKNVDSAGANAATITDADRAAANTLFTIK